VKSAPTSFANEPAPKRLVALAGNPNSGKTTLFNALTGLRQKVGNYAGVTVERKIGTLRLDDDVTVDVLDLPGTYSLTARSPEEAIARNVLLGEAPDTPRPDVVVVVADASNLERNLFLATQILEIGVPTILALNMMDVAESHGTRIHVGRLEESLGVPVIPMVASRGEGVDALRERLGASELPPSQQRRWKLTYDVESAVKEVAALLATGSDLTHEAADSEAIRLLANDDGLDRFSNVDRDAVRKALHRGREALESVGDEPPTFEAEYRYRWIRGITRQCVERRSESVRSLSDRADAVLTHKVVGPLVFVGLMALVFQAIFAWATIPMGWIDSGITAVGALVTNIMPDGALRSLLVDGVIAGVGAVVIFLPQILFLFLFIGLLEDTGYMARAAFMMDKLMRRVGLHGKAFIPLLSSFACAVPGIMATRTIENQKDRFVTILVAPLMTCSARLPVYTILLTAFLPGGAGAKALTLTALYVAGVVAAIGSAFLLKRTLLKSETPTLILELPPYKLPNPRSVLLNMWDRSRLFLQRAGTIILSVSIVLWFLATYPRSDAIHEEFAAKRAALESAASDETRDSQRLALDAEEAGAALRASFAGTIGHVLEPVIRPLGFDWKIGIGLVASFAAREVFVSTMGTIYSVGDVGDDTTPLVERLKDAKWEQGNRAGTPVFTFPTVVALLVFYVIALQCMSTVATIWRETNSWKWPLFAWTYMAALAYVAAYVARLVVEVVV
jgi:ferrous iron transport protein B